MPSSPRPFANGRGRIPMSDLRDTDHSSPFRDTPTHADDEDDIGGERDRMLPKNEFYAADLVPAPPSRRWRCIGPLCGLAVLIGMALLVTFHTNQAGQSDLLEMLVPPSPSEDTQFSGLATAWHPLPTVAPIAIEEPLEPTKPDNPVKPAKIRKAIVMASYQAQKVDWVQNLKKYTKGWEIFRYVADDPNTEFLSVPNENGREAMAFLTFIIDHYYTLPDYTVFSHGHDRAWHQPEHTIDKLMALNLTAVAEENYVNLRCAQSPGCTADTKFYFSPHNNNDHRPGMSIEEGFWDHVMADEFGPLPPVFGRRCCAQFAVSKHAIQLRSHEFWKSLRAPLLGTIDDIRKAWGPNIDKYRLGSLYEQVWHILFGKDADFCPSKETCQEIHFSNVIHCDGETTSFKDNKDNWNQIACTNDLRKAIDSGVSLDSVFPNESSGPPTHIPDVLPSQQEDSQPAAAG